MDRFKKTMIDIDSNKFTINELVSILVLIISKININSISGMARSESKTPRGVRISGNYKKILIGDIKACINGIKEDKLPF